MTTYDIVWYVLEADRASEGMPIARPNVAILLSYGRRPWFEIRDRRGRPRPIGRISAVVSANLDFDVALLDVLLALWPEHFEACASLGAVKAKLARAEILDFQGRPERIPAEWAALREEARPIYERLKILRVDAPVSAPESFLARAEPREGE